jgi:hypothetical protein
MIKKIIFFPLLLSVVIGFQSCKQTQPEEKEESDKNWQSLFNGKTLEGWTPKIKGEPFGSDPLNTFMAKNGLLKVSYKNYDSFNNRFGHLFYKTPYSNYRLKLQYRFVGKQVEGGEGWAEKNSGIMIHSQDPKSMGLDQDFPNSLEVQLLGGVNDSVPRPTGNLCTPGTHVHINEKLEKTHCITANAPTIYGEEWVDVEVEVYSDSLIRHYINGKPVIEYTIPVYDTPEDTINHLKPVKSGYISLQSESHPIEFKTIQIMNLDTKN